MKMCGERKDIPTFRLLIFGTGQSGTGGKAECPLFARWPASLLPERIDIQVRFVDGSQAEPNAD
jgi:hypothetical protein